MTTKELAALYRRMGAPNPVAAACGSEGHIGKVGTNKFHALKHTVDGITFDSRREARAYQSLKVLRDTGAILDLRLQPRFMVQDAFRTADGTKVRAITWRPDFSFVRAEAPEQLCIVECKGGKATQTQAFQLRLKMFRAKWPGVEIQIWD